MHLEWKYRQDMFGTKAYTLSRAPAATGNILPFQSSCRSGISPSPVSWELQSCRGLRNLYDCTDIHACTRHRHTAKQRFIPYTSFNADKRTLASLNHPPNADRTSGHWMKKHVFPCYFICFSKFYFCPLLFVY